MTDIRADGKFLLATRSTADSTYQLYVCTLSGGSTSATPPIGWLVR